MSKDYGTVIFNGKEYVITQAAYPVNYGTDGDVRYEAAAVSDGKDYIVVWATTPEWREATRLYNETGEISGFYQDESNACDWYSPIEVREI